MSPACLGKEDGVVSLVGDGGFEGLALAWQGVGLFALAEVVVGSGGDGLLAGELVPPPSMPFSHSMDRPKHHDEEHQSRYVFSSFQ